jgi:hypothetical protein
MKPITRGSLVAAITGVAATVGAVGPAAAASPSIPVTVPLGSVSQATGVEVPTVNAEMPLLMPGVPQAPRFVAGQYFPERTLPQVPVNGALPGVDTTVPLPHVLGDDLAGDRLGVDAPVSDLRALTPGLALDAPLAPPGAGSFGIPQPKLPEAGVMAPVLQTAADANLQSVTDK